MDLNSISSPTPSSRISIDTQQTPISDLNDSSRSVQTPPSSQATPSNINHDALPPCSRVSESVGMPGLLPVGQAVVSQPSLSTQSDIVSHNPQSTISPQNDNHTDAKGLLLQQVSSESNLPIHPSKPFNDNTRDAATPFELELPKLSHPSAQLSPRAVSSPSKMTLTYSNSIPSSQSPKLTESPSLSTSPSHHSRTRKHRLVHGSPTPAAMKSLIPRGFRKSGHRSKSTNISSSPSISPSQSYRDLTSREKAYPFFDSNNPDIGK